LTTDADNHIQSTCCELINHPNCSASSVGVAHMLEHCFLLPSRHACSRG